MGIKFALNLRAFPLTAQSFAPFLLDLYLLPFSAFLLQNEQNSHVLLLPQMFIGPLSAAKARK